MTDDQIKQSIAGAIRSIRLTKGLSQEELAGLSDVPQSTIGGIESARSQPRADTLYKIAAGMGTTPNDILREAGLLPGSMLGEGGPPSYGDPILERLMVLALSMDEGQRRFLTAVAEKVIEYWSGESDTPGS